jgi:glucuronoarabinoxylan endo-1,4-beta-xylanase
MEATYASNTDEATVSKSIVVSLSRTLQAENADEMTESSIDTQHAGYNGDGYLNFNAMSGAAATYTDLVGFIGDAGDTTLTFRYALGGDSARTIALNVNGEQVTDVTFNSTGDWNVWETHSLTVTLDSEDTITLETTGDEGPNLDQITFSDAESRSVSP